MSNVFYIKRGDTSPKMVYTLDPPVALGGASAVFNMRPVTNSGADAIDRAPANIEDVAGVLSFEFTSAHTAATGVFWGEFEVTYADAAVETFPNIGYIVVKVVADLG